MYMNTQIIWGLEFGLVKFCKDQGWYSKRRKKLFTEVYNWDKIGKFYKLWWAQYAQKINLHVLVAWEFHMPRDSEILKSNKLYLTLPLWYPNQQVVIKLP